MNDSGLQRMGLTGRALCCLLISGGLVPAAMGEENMSFRQLASIRRVRSADISPDGRWIAYTLDVPRDACTDENGASWRELHVVDLEGRSRPFVSGKVNVSAVRWTPDGQHLSFLAKRQGDEHTALYCIPAGGGEARRLLAHEADIDSYSWAPDGRRVAFVAMEKPDKAREKLKDRGFIPHVFEEDWRPKRVWIAAVRVDWVPSAEGDESAETRMLELDGSASMSEWSPDGKRLVVALAADPALDSHIMARQPVVVDVETGAVTGRLNHQGKLGDCVWSRDSRRIAVLCAADLHDPGDSRLKIGSAEGGELRPLADRDDADIVSVDWQSDDSLLVVRHQGVWSRLVELSATDGAEKELAAPEDVILRHLSLSADGQVAAFVGDSPLHPREVYVMKHGDAGPRRLTHSNPWLAELNLGAQEVVRYRARDGEWIDGLLIRPASAAAKQPLPLIVVVHGGPESHYSNGWLTRYSEPGQLAAGRGFAVFYPNYRGSTGRGVAFAKSSQNDYGGKEFDDVIDGIDYLIKRGVADERRVGITGGSYGGFAAAWCATVHSQRFGASVMFAGVSDHISKFGTTDIPREMVAVHSRSYPWDDWDAFRERSPVYHFQKCRTPILIAHGGKDNRVHPSQALMMYRYLKAHGKVPVRLVLYPEEGHGNRKAAARLDYSMRLMRWMTHYLTGPGGDLPPLDLDYGCPDKDVD